MDNLKCLSDHVSAHTFVDFIDACETLRKELLKSMKIAKKLEEELKLANLEKEELVVRLDESNKKNEEKLFNVYLQFKIQEKIFGRAMKKISLGSRGLVWGNFFFPVIFMFQFYGQLCCEVSHLILITIMSG